MKILISNDDGYLAPGLIALAKALTSIAEITVVAPDSNRSGSSNSLTLGRPLSVTHSTEDAYALYIVNGTPSDCVHLALTGLLPGSSSGLSAYRPDLVVSGINQGQNMGDDTLYSGTVAAATEGYLFGIPSIAFSQVEPGWAEIDAAAMAARDIVQRQFAQLSKPYLLNVNIPNRPYQALTHTLATRLGKRHASESVHKQRDPFGNDIFWIGPAGKVKDGSDGTDFHAIEQGAISITPLQVDLTHSAQLQALRAALT